MNYKKAIQILQSNFNILNKWFIVFNNNPNIVFGRRYTGYKKWILKHYSGYDNKNDLIKLANHAIKTVPFYKAATKGQEVISIESFKKHFPLIDKSIITNNFNDFISETSNLKKYDLLTTAGTSGFPLRMYLPKDRYIQELANLHVLWNKAFGYNFDIRGAIKNAHVKTFQINPVNRELVFDGFNLTEPYFEYVYSILKKYKVKFLLCYPSSAYEFSKFLYNKGKDYSFLDAIMVCSENLYDHQKNFIREKLGLRVFTWYGHTEKLVMAGYCSGSDLFHVESNYGFCELLDENGNEVTIKGAIGEIVGTTLHNYGMPLIRYRTGDYAEYYGEECPHCGRKVKLFKKILGRWSGDKIYKADGTFVTSTALNLHDELYTVIDGLQYYQEKKGELFVRIIANKNYTSGHEEAILKHYRDKMVNGKVIINKVESLEKLKNGKFLLLISKIKD